MRLGLGINLGPRGAVAAAPEPANLITFGSEFDNAAWTKAGVTITPNAGVAADGSTTADLFVEDSALSGHTANRIVAATIGQRYRISVDAEYAGRQWLFISIFGTASPGTDESWFDVLNGIKGIQQANVTSAISTVRAGLYRLTAEFTAAATANFTFGFYAASANNSTANFTGSGANAYYLSNAKVQAI